MRCDVLLQRQSRVLGFDARLVSRPIKLGVLVFGRRPYPLAKFLDILGRTTRCSFVFFSCLKSFSAVVYELLSISHL